MHTEVHVEDSLLMAGERPERAAAPCGSIHVHVPGADACYARGLAAGADSLAPPTDQPYGDRSAGLRDAEGKLCRIGTHFRD